MDDLERKLNFKITDSGRIKVKLPEKYSCEKESYTYTGLGDLVAVTGIAIGSWYILYRAPDIIDFIINH